MASKSPPVIHRGVSLMLCASAAVLKETLAQIDFSDVAHQKIGERALVVPAHRVTEVREALHERGIYPRVVGDARRIERVLEGDDEEAEDADEEAVSSDDEEES